MPMRRTRRCKLRVMESQLTAIGPTLLLTGEERAVLARVLHVVADEWWLDENEQVLLERLESGHAVLAPA